MEKTGQDFGEYEVMEEVGRGAMGVVYRAVDRRIGREVALKIIKMTELGEGQSREQLQERLRREARAAGILSHPRIVTIYGLQELENVNYIVMEFVNGPTLTQLLEKVGSLPAQRVGEIIQQAAQGLDYAHRRGVFHRDVKPANLMISDTDEVKITDFGVAKIVKDQGMTQAGTLMGTPYYMSPEQIMGQTLTGASDQFALAVIAYELLAGRKPFDSENLPGLIHQILTQPPPNCEPMNEQFGPGVGEVLKKALSKNPSDRFPSCTAFGEALSNALAGRPMAATPIPALVPPNPLGETTANAARAVSLRVFNWKLTIGLSALVALFVAFLVYRGTMGVRKDEDGKSGQVIAENKTPVPPPVQQPVEQQPPAESNQKTGEANKKVEQKAPRETPSTTKSEKRPVETAHNVTPPVQKQNEPTVATPPLPPPEVEEEPTGDYGTRRSGQFEWLATATPLAPGDILRIKLRKIQKGGGELSGSYLKGLKPVDITEVTPAAASIVEAPSEANKYAAVAVKNTSDQPLQVIRFRWRLR